MSLQIDMVDFVIQWMMIESVLISRHTMKTVSYDKVMNDFLSGWSV